MAVLDSSIQIGKHTVKNRIVLPPLVICGLHKDGHVNDDVVAHYRSFAEGGAGIVIQEATCVSEDGRLAGPQLGLWNDGHIDEMRRIVGAVKPSGALLLVQIHYASKQGEPDHIVQVGPSEYTNDDEFHRALSTDEVRRIRDDFIAAARRAEIAGYDGVELHGAHGYLLCAFMNSVLNRRDDAYGDTGLLNREIIEGIRAVTGPDFLVTARVGVDNPDMATGIAHCKALEALGLNLLNISSGMARTEKLGVPKDFPFSKLAWRGSEVKKYVNVPVIAVGKLDDPADAAALIEGGYADFAAIGRGMLVDPEWANKVLSGEKPVKCHDCKECVWFRHHDKCPGRRKYDKEKAKNKD